MVRTYSSDGHASFLNLLHSEIYRPDVKEFFFKRIESKNGERRGIGASLFVFATFCCGEGSTSRPIRAQRRCRRSTPACPTRKRRHQCTSVMKLYSSERLVDPRKVTISPRQWSTPRQKEKWEHSNRKRATQFRNCLATRWRYDGFYGLSYYELRRVWHK